MKKQVLIFDCDGVLVDSSHRYKLLDNGKIDLAHWRANEHLCGNDSLLPMADYYKQELKNPNSLVIVATAREMKKPDFDFFRDVLGMPHYLIYRKQGDNRKGAEMKFKGLRKVMNLRQFKPAFANIHIFEDNTEYLKGMVDNFYTLGYNAKGYYIPSKQGH